jgi:ligand-binding sensor domain-containing protein
MSYNAYGQQVNFNKLMPPDGENFSGIMSFTQDKNGTIWMATANGVYSYDGVKITTFKTNPVNPNSLANNFALSICTDRKGMVWIGTQGGGLEMLNPETGDFTHYTNDPNNPASLVDDVVIVTFVDSHGIYWIGTVNGLDKFDPETNTFFHYEYDANDTTSISNNQVRVIYEDQDGTLWIGTGSPYSFWGNPENGGLNKLNRETNTFTRYTYDSNNIHSLANNTVTAIFEDSKNTF